LAPRLGDRVEERPVRLVIATADEGVLALERLEGAVLNVGAEIERAWATDESASGPASVEGENGAAPINLSSAAATEVPAKEPV
jgi:hypothetical protein